MGATVLRAARRRPYVFPVAVAVVFAATAAVVAVVEHLPIRDPDGTAGPPIFRLTAIIAICLALDVLPRAAWRARGRPQALWAQVRAVVAERWTRRRMTLVFTGLLSFYVTYVAYRTLKGFLPLLRPERHDAGLLNLDRSLLGGHDPAVVLHQLLGTGIANQVLSLVYVAYVLFVPVSLVAALLWFGRDLRQGMWYASALSVNWVLGVVSYYAIPSLGPAFVAPQYFADLPASPSSALQHMLWSQRLDVLFSQATGRAGEAVQEIAAFASLHVSVVFTAALMATLVRARRSIRVALWTYLVLVALATIYLGWHYLLDDVAGLAIGAIAVLVGAVATGHVPTLSRRSRQQRPARAPVPAPRAAPRALNAPNVLSMVRIAIAPVVALLVLAHPEGSGLAAAAFATGAATDLLDGQLARRRGLITPLGKLLDPAADKLLVIAALSSLVAVHRLALWAVTVIAAREVLVTWLRALALRRGQVIAAGLPGKAKMCLQVVMVLVLVAVPHPGAPWVHALVLATVALTVASGYGYLRGALGGPAPSTVTA